MSLRGEEIVSARLSSSERLRWEKKIEIEMERDWLTDRYEGKYLQEAQANSSRHGCGCGGGNAVELRSFAFENSAASIRFERALLMHGSENRKSL